MPQDLAQILHSVLYHSDFSHHEYSRLDACLAVDALLRDRLDVPRIYLSPITAPSSWEMVAHCVLTCVKSTKSKTKKILQALGIGTTLPQSMQERLDLQEMVMNVLEAGWGQGQVLYEMARFTPFTNEDIYERTITERSTNKDFAELRILLVARAKAKAELQAAHHNLTSACVSSDLFNIVLKRKLETTWQVQWLTHHTYRNRGIDERLVETLLFTEEF